MPTQIQLRRDTAADWTSNNPTMAAGEFGWESDTNRFKIGTGTTAWNSLEYADTLKSLGDMTITGSTISAPSNGDLTLTTAGSGVVLVNDSFKIGSGATVTTILDEDGFGSNSATALATQQSIKAYVDANSGGDLGDISFNGSTIIAPSNADLTLDPSGTGAVAVLGSQTITNTTTDDSLTITTTEDSSSAGPVITLKRNSSSPADADYLGQIKFKGENDADQQVTYAKISGKISDASDTTEDGIIEISHIKAGSNTITGRFKSDKYQLLNGTELEVAGALTASTSLNIAGDGATVTGIKDEDDFSSNSATKLATQQSIKAYVDNEIANVSVGDLSFIGSTIAAPSNADLTLTSSNGNVVIEGLRVSGTTIQTEDSSTGIEIAGNLIPSQDGVFQLGSSSRRWQTLYVAAETIDLGGATISSDGSGTLAIAATGATLPTGSKVGQQPLVLAGKTTKTSARPVQIVKLFVSDGSSNFTDAQLLERTADLELEFNGTVETVPVYTEAQQTFTLESGQSLSDNAGGITLFQF